MSIIYHFPDATSSSLFEWLSRERQLIAIWQDVICRRLNDTRFMETYTHVTAILYFGPKYPAMRVSYLVAIGVVVLFALFFVLDYVHTAAPEGKKPDSPQTQVSTQSDSLAPIHKGDIIKNGNSTRDVFKALADDDKADTSQAVIKALPKQDELQ